MVDLRIKRSFELEFNDGTKKTFGIDELREIRDRLNRLFHSEITPPATRSRVVITADGQRIIRHELPHTIRPSIDGLTRQRNLMLEKFTTQIESTRKVTLPRLYSEIGRKKCGPRSGYVNNTYVYAKHVNGCYGFKIVNGKESSFFKLGTIKDPNSIIGAFIRALPSDKVFLKYDILKFKLSYVTQGQKMKALLDILEIDGYLIKKPLLNRRGKIGYKRSQKSLDLDAQNSASKNSASTITVTDQITKHGLEVENNDELRKVPRVSSNPLAVSGRLT